jgi:hypothetical protein
VPPVRRDDIHIVSTDFQGNLVSPEFAAFCGFCERVGKAVVPDGETRGRRENARGIARNSDPTSFGTSVIQR